MNPLLNLKLPWLLSWLIGQLLGSQWRVKLWNNTLTAVEGFLSTNAGADEAAVEVFLTGHINDFVNSLVHGNIFLATAIENALDPIFTAIVSNAFTAATAALAAEGATPNPNPPVTTVTPEP